MARPTRLVHPAPERNAIVVVSRKLWMKVIKALARWRWRA
jgi:phosphoglycolate phosphatase